MGSRPYGIVLQILVPLVAVAAGVVAVASWLDFQALAGANRAAALRELSLEARRRAEVDDRLFMQAERNLIQCRDLMRMRLADPPPPRTFPPRSDGTARLLPGRGQAPLGAFLARGATDDDGARRSLTAAVGLLTELGPSWCSELPAVAIGEPARWLATWGTAFSDLTATMLPDDPVLLGTETDLLSQAGDDVRWSGPYFEPATETWCVTALAPVGPAHGPRIAVYHPVPVRELLARVGEGLPPGTITAVLDRNGRAIACTGSPPPPEAPGEVVVALPPRLAAAMAGLAGASTGVHPAAADDGWLAVSRLAGPGWAVVTHLPPELVVGPARRAAGHVLLVGGLAITVLALAIAFILRWRVALPLRGLQDEVARLAHGGAPPEERPARRDEIGSLITAFDRMSGEVASSQAGLREALEALGQRERLYRALFAAAADAVLVLRDGKVTEANERACRLFGAEAVRLMGADPGTLAPELQPDGVPSGARFTAFLGRPPEIPAPWRAKRIDGAEIDTEVSVGRVARPEGDLLVLALRDVTERNQLEQQLRQVQKMETVGQLAGGVAHDFNNLLTGIVGSAELLGRRLTADERGRDLVARILQAGDRAAALVRKLLTFARKGRQVSTPLDVHGVVRDTCALLERSIDPRITLDQRLAAERSVVVGDATLLQTALLNLGVNARDAMPGGGSLIFATDTCQIGEAEGRVHVPPLAAGAYLEVSVADTGTGMPPEVRRRLFEPFFTTKPTGKGTGLGLAAVLRTVHDHQGAVEVASEPGRGTTFRLLLPLSDRQADPIAAERPPVRGQGRILVVDDDDLVRGTAVEMLHSLGYETAEARDGRAGADAYVPGVYAAVMIDMEMPVLRGVDCLREIRLRDPLVRAILCSGFSREGGSADLRGMGFRGYLQKPYGLYDLSRVVAAVAAGGEMT